MSVLRRHTRLLRPALLLRSTYLAMGHVACALLSAARPAARHPQLAVLWKCVRLEWCRSYWRNDTPLYRARLSPLCSVRGGDGQAGGLVESSLASRERSRSLQSAIEKSAHCTQHCTPKPKPTHMNAGKIMFSSDGSSAQS